MHVFSMAEELRALGNEIVMLVPDGIETVKRHREPSFPILLYDQSLGQNLPFPSKGSAQIIHAWTPREHVRKITLALAKKEQCPYVLHMEDNEEQIVSDELRNLDFRSLGELPTLYQDLLISPYRTHPTHYRSFAEGASGYTCLIDKLLEFKPQNVPGAVFWAGFDPEFEHLPSDAWSARAEHGIKDHEKIIFYSGNVHRSTLADVRNLYLAISLLRMRGRSVRLLRTGWNFAEIDIIKDPDVAAAAIELGFVDRVKMPTLLALSDLLVQPGRSDRFNDYRFPSKLPEYLVSGKPLILPASNIGNALEDGRHALKLYDGTLAELVGKIQQLLDNPEQADRMGKEARTFALANLRWSKAAKIANDHYAQILSAPAEIALDTEARPVAPSSSHPVRLICFYLPQFHPIKENDEWWGKGFTEWTNVARAKPYIFGQRHPRLPTELGFYDLRVAETLHEQATLANEHGIGGFCFYVYWFNGRRLLERPVDLWLERGPDFPFCICWANENWSRRWDGSESDILMSQDYLAGFEERFVVDMLPILKDPRYIRVNGAPLLAIYRVSELPDPVGSARALRDAAARHGIPEIHLVMIQSFGLTDPRPYGCDAAVEFSPPHTNRLLLVPERIGGVSPNFSGYVEDYVGVAAQSINARPTDYIRYRGCFPMWDNTARRGSRGHVFVNDSPKAYGHWLRFLVNEAMERREQIEPLVFINAWNEWAEGTYLEPDEHHGRMLLEVTRTALAHGVADFAQGGSNPERDREFSRSVSRLPKMP